MTDRSTSARERRGDLSGKIAFGEEQQGQKDTANENEVSPNRHEFTALLIREACRTNGKTAQLFLCASESPQAGYG
jgi:hypothetical protein